MTPQGTVYVVDDDAAVLKSMSRLLGSARYRVETFGSSDEFLSAEPPAEPGCVILDLHLSGGESGLDVQNQMIDAGFDVPVIFLSGEGDVPSSVAAMKSGAVDFLTKPVDAEVLFAVVQRSLDQDRAHRAVKRREAEIKRRLDCLTQREGEVMELVIAGMLNKQIAARMTIAEKTVKVHRARVMEKMQVESVAQLVRTAEIAGVVAPLAEVGF